MKARFVIKALLGSSAAIVVSNAGTKLGVSALLQPSAAVAHARGADSDSLKSGRSGKLRGPLFS
jgi:hypothetical protein